MGLFGKKEKTVTRYYENTGRGERKKKTEVNYKNGKVDGLWVDYYENGKKCSEENYKDGKRDGLCTEWYENGQKGMERNLKNGECSKHCVRLI